LLISDVIIIIVPVLFSLSVDFQFAMPTDVKEPDLIYLTTGLLTPEIRTPGPGDGAVYT
jgi:hypothetical protein